MSSSAAYQSCSDIHIEEEGGDESVKFQNIEWPAEDCLPLLVRRVRELNKKKLIFVFDDAAKFPSGDEQFLAWMKALQRMEEGFLLELRFRNLSASAVLAFVKHAIPPRTPSSVHLVLSLGETPPAQLQQLKDALEEKNLSFKLHEEEHDTKTTHPTPNTEVHSEHAQQSTVQKTPNSEVMISSSSTEYVQENKEKEGGGEDGSVFCKKCWLRTLRKKEKKMQRKSRRRRHRDHKKHYHSSAAAARSSSSKSSGFF